MIGLGLPDRGGRPLKLLCLGAHCDDIEIGAGGTILRLLRENPGTEVLWVIFSSTEAREKEARACAQRFLAAAGKADIRVQAFRDGFLPYAGVAVKEAFEALKAEFAPDLILTHYRHDLHQDLPDGQHLLHHPLARSLRGRTIAAGPEERQYGLGLPLISIGRTPASDVRPLMDSRSRLTGCCCRYWRGCWWC